MSAPSFDFDDFVRGVASTIAEHLPDETQAEQPTPPGSSLPAPGSEFIFDYEKVLWHFPDTASRIIEEPR